MRWREQVGSRTRSGQQLMETYNILIPKIAITDREALVNNVILARTYLKIV